MLQLTRRVCLRVEIGNLLQLRDASSCGIVQTAPRKKTLGAVCIQRSDALHIRLTFERFGDAFRQPLKLSTERTLVADRDQTAHARNLYGNQIQRGKLRGSKPLVVATAISGPASRCTGHHQLRVRS